MYMAALLLETATLNSLGPGAGPWRVEPPEAHGLDGTLLAAAADTAARLVPERFCLLVVKDGVIVHESTFVNRSDTQYESDSLAKTATALVVGAAVEAGLFELDVPLARYGVRPRCGAGAPQDCWRAHCPPGRPCPDGPLGFWPNVTARTLLSQSSGCVTGRGCFAEPGTAFTYDSESYIQHLAHLLDQRVSASSPNATARQFGSALLAKLGLPHFYAADRGAPGDVDGREFWAGGGQPMSCRDAARIAQLVLNRGLWPSAATAGAEATGTRAAEGAPTRLVAEEFIAQMTTPQYPARGFSYGFLTWLNAKHADHAGSAPCCAPRWGPRETCSGPHLATALLGDDLADLAPADVAVGMGWLAKYLFVVPSRNLSLVSLGASWGSSLQCRLGHTQPTDPPYNDGYDDSFSASVLWKALDAAMMTPSEQPTRPRPVIHSAPSVVSAATLSAIATVTAATAATATAATAATAASAAAAATATSPVGAAAVITSVGGGHDASSEPVAPPPPQTHGSCTCLCPPGRGFGGCYDLDAAPPPGSSDAERCRPFQPLAPRDCPAVGIVRQCHTPARLPGDEDCAAAGAAMRGDVGTPNVWGGHLNCTLRAPCAADPLVGAFAATATCSCQPVRYGDYACHWTPMPCAKRGPRAFMLGGARAHARSAAMPLVGGDEVEQARRG